MANPPFNVNWLDKDKLAGDKDALPFGSPQRPTTCNYIWIQLFYSSLDERD